MLEVVSEVGYRDLDRVGGVGAVLQVLEGREGVRLVVGAEARDRAGARVEEWRCGC